MGTDHNVAEQITHGTIRPTDDTYTEYEIFEHGSWVKVEIAKQADEWLEKLYAGQVITKQADEWLEKLYDAKLIQARSVAREFIGLAVESMRSGNILLIDRILLLADPSKLSLHAIIALNRSTFMYNKHLKNWCSFRDKAKDFLKSEGKKPEMLLAGLKGPETYVSRYPEMDDFFRVHPSLK